MEKGKINEIINRLQKLNWDFSDFTSTKYPLDLNSIPWYPATFISPIPKLLVASLSEQGDTVLDPFGGKGTTAIETILQNRNAIYCDLNPFAAENVEGLFAALEYVLLEKKGLENERERVISNIPRLEEVDEIIQAYSINLEIKDWFHENTILMLLAIVKLIYKDESEGNNRLALIRKLAFSSILKFASSQQGHYTYITDNCKPVQKREKDATSLYCDKIEQIIRAAQEFIIQYRLAYPEADLKLILKRREIVTGDARDLSWITDGSVDLVVTSPPYLCSQDYIKTMRLMNLFFENRKAFEYDIKEEIGSRAMRKKKSDVVAPKFYSDMRVVFENINRVLKQDSFFALVIGQGKAKVISEYDIIADLIDMLQSECGLSLIFRKERRIGGREIQVGGVDRESILIFQK